MIRVYDHTGDVIETRAQLRVQRATNFPRGRDNGGVGLHPEHGPDYFAAFVFDPDGHRIEAVVAKKA
jgi:hypothetical protein